MPTAFVPSFTVTQSNDGSYYIITDTSNYAGFGGKANFTNRQLIIEFFDGTTQAYSPTPFSFANYPSDALTIDNQTVDYCLRITLSVTQIGSSTLSTTAASNILSTSATSGGNITDAGGGTISARGVCWNTTGTPTLSDSFTSDGTGTGSFSSSLTGLTPDTTYYVRAYATNEAETTYGNQIIFTTSVATSYILSTVSASNYTANKGTTGNVVYALQIQNVDATGRSITSIAGRLIGINIGADVAVSGFKIYRNSSPNLSGSPTLAVSGSVSGTNAFDFDYTGLNIFIGAGLTRWLVFSLDINSSATTGHTLNMNGVTNPIVLTWDSASVQQNNQSNVSPTITVGV